MQTRSHDFDLKFKMFLVMFVTICSREVKN